MGRRFRGTVTAEVDVDDLISELSDRDVREAFEDRFGVGMAVDYDLLAEVREELNRNRPNAALALVESALCARRVSDDARRDAYEAAARAH